MGDLVELLESNLNHVAKLEDNFDHVQDGQNPDFVTVCCSDSRVLQDHMWANEDPGKIFTVGNIGNRAFQKNQKNEKVVSGDLIYPVEHTETDKIIIVGHTGCGAVTATFKSIKGELGEQPKGIKHCIEMMKQNLEPAMSQLEEQLTDKQKINRLVEYNVDKQVEFLKSSEEVPEDREIVGVVYDFQDVYSGKRGQIHVINVNGKREEKEIKQEYPELQERFERLSKL